MVAMASSFSASVASSLNSRIAARREHADGFLGIGKLVVCEFADRVLERSGHDRKCRRDHQQYCERERTEVSKSLGNHWTTPAGVGRRRLHRRLLRSLYQRIS